LVQQAGDQEGGRKKMNAFTLAVLFYVAGISLFKMLAVVGKHYFVAFSHDGDIFVNSVTLLITDISKVAW
jgi:hypothetical protein